MIRHLAKSSSEDREIAAQTTELAKLKHMFEKCRAEVVQQFAHLDASVWAELLEQHPQLKQDRDGNGEDGDGDEAAETFESSSDLPLVGGDISDVSTVLQLFESKHERYKDAFEAYVKKMYGEENLYFVERMMELKRCMNTEEGIESCSNSGREFLMRGREIVDEFVRRNAEFEVNLPDDIRDEIIMKMETGVEGSLVEVREFLIVLFKSAEEEVIQLLNLNYLNGFKKVMKQPT